MGGRELAGRVPGKSKQRDKVRQCGRADESDGIPAKRGEGRRTFRQSVRLRFVPLPAEHKLRREGDRGRTRTNARRQGGAPGRRWVLRETRELCESSRPTEARNGS